MNDNKTLKDIIIEETEQELASNLPEFSASPEEMLAKVKAKEKKTKRHRLGYFVFAAVLLLAFVAIGMKCSDTFLTVDADKNGKEEIVTDDGVIIEDEGWGSSSETIFQISQWEDIELVKYHVSELMIPNYWPKGYIFESLFVEILENGYTCRFVFTEGKEQIEIHEHMTCENMQSVEVDRKEKEIICKKGYIYIRDYKDFKIATISCDDGLVIEVNSNLDDAEIVKIIESMN